MKEISSYPNSWSSSQFSHIIRQSNTSWQLLVAIIRNCLYYTRNHHLFTSKLETFNQHCCLGVIHLGCSKSSMDLNTYKLSIILLCSVFIIVLKEILVRQNNVYSRHFIMPIRPTGKSTHKYWPFGWIYLLFIRFRNSTHRQSCVFLKGWKHV